MKHAVIDVVEVVSLVVVVKVLILLEVVCLEVAQIPCEILR